jgi:NAD(P)-dependent dehydrogenase (short-subunit alcohol dehydrogenase family)
MLLTGASRGIGHATVKLFYQSGWRVLTVSRAPVAEDCPWPGGRDNHIQADLSDPASFEFSLIRFDGALAAPDFMPSSIMRQSHRNLEMAAVRA